MPTLRGIDGQCSPALRTHRPRSRKAAALLPFTNHGQFRFKFLDVGQSGNEARGEGMTALCLRAIEDVLKIDLRAERQGQARPRASWGAGGVGTVGEERSSVARRPSVPLSGTGSTAFASVVAPIPCNRSHSLTTAPQSHNNPGPLIADHPGTLLQR
jgi:hypothetical protein